MRNVTISQAPIGLIILFLLTNFNFGISQGSMVAKYPLQMEGEKILRLYDVSGNGLHGRLVNKSRTQIADIFRRAEIFPKASCIQKIAPEDAAITIPDVYSNKDITKTGFTVSFWLYLDFSSDQPDLKTYDPVSIVSLPDISIVRQYTKVGTSVKCQFILIYSNDTYSSPDIVTLQTPVTKSGWHFFAVGYDPYYHPQRGKTETLHNIDMYSYYLDTTLYYDSSPLAMKFSQSLGFGNLIKRGTKKEGTLLDTKFLGKAWNITFYDYKLGLESINDDRNNSYYLAKEGMDHPGRENFYIIKSATSFYPCNEVINPYETQIWDVVGLRNSISTRGVDFTDDRFGNKKSALLMTDYGNVTLPAFYESASQFKTPEFDVRRGFTISFWTYIDRFLYPPDDQSVPYFTTDTAFHFFHIASKGYEGGFERIRDRLVLNRFINLNPTRDWKMWLWDPISFGNQKGWYHVIFTQKENAIKVLMYKPNGERVATMNYFNSQDYSKLTSARFGFGIDKHDEIGPLSSACRYLDDVRVYSWPFSEEEADELHNYDLIKPKK